MVEFRYYNCFFNKIHYGYTILNWIMCQEHTAMYALTSGGKLLYST
jgi:hypothetical protein